MSEEKLKYKILRLRYRFCQMCLSDYNAVYKKMCRKPGDKHDCIPQSLLDDIENELFKK